MSRFCPLAVRVASCVALGTAIVPTSGCAVASESLDEPVDEARSPIQGGSVDALDKGVVGVAITDAGGRVVASCSGTLIAPNLVLTAQHCLSPNSRFVSCALSLFGPLVSDAQVLVTTSDAMWGGQTGWIEVVEIVTAPGSPRVCGSDLALLFLGGRVEGVKPIPPRLDGGVIAGDYYTAIGYGDTGADADDAGVRRRRDSLEVLCTGSACDSAQVDGREWRGDHGICAGDSGGPAIDPSGRVIGVTSRGPSGCDSPVYGGLDAFGDWLRSAGERAARRGEYAAAEWVGADPDPAVASGSGCAIGPNSGDLRGDRVARRGAVVWTVLGLAALALRRAGARRLG